MPYKPTGGPRGRPPHPGLLTPAEQRVLDLLRDGLTDAQIAERLTLSRDTVHTHVSHMLSKLDLHDRRALAAWQPEPETAPVGHRRWFGIGAALGRVRDALPGSALVAGVALGGVVVLTAAALAFVGVSSRLDDDGEPTVLASVTATGTPALVVPGTPSPGPATGTPAITPTPPTTPTPSATAASPLAFTSSIVATVDPDDSDGRLIVGASDFIDSENGWAVAGTRVFSTADGGASWNEETRVAAQISELEFVTLEIGWAVTQSGGLLRTGDGGASWSKVALDPSEIRDAAHVFFLDEQRGWLTGYAGVGWAIFATLDGGETWSAAVDPCGDRGTPMVEFLPDGTGWTLCAGSFIDLPAYNALHTTTDFGETWQWISATDDPLDEAPPAPAALDLKGDITGMSFVDASNGWATVNYELYSTEDGGISWELSEGLAPGRFTSSPTLITTTSGTIAAGSDLLRTEDGGRTWAVILGAETPFAVDFVNEEIGLGIGWSPAATRSLFRTEDGGESWAVVGPLPGDALELDFATSEAGWLLLDPEGEGGVMATTDGGLTWERLPGADVPGLEWHISLVSEAGGFVRSSSGPIYTTADSGFTFEEVTSTLARGPISFASTSEGWRVDGADRGITTLHATVDGGANWRALGAVDGGIQDIALTANGAGWLLAANLDHNLLRTQDGGATWTRIVLEGRRPRSIAAVDSEHVWFLDQIGRLFRTEDGGATWTRVGTGP